jgi:CHRD domain
MVKLGGVRHAAMGGLLIAALATGSVAVASDGDGSDDSTTILSVALTGFEEDPLALSTTGSGTLRVRIDDHNQDITYQLTFTALEAPATQAHIHFGGRAQSGGISVFLCSNLGNGPAGTPACPAAGGTVTGTLHAVDVVGPAAQGIAPGEFGELVAAIRNGTAYGNVHSQKYPGGEIRGQLDHEH